MCYNNRVNTPSYIYTNYVKIPNPADIGYPSKD